MTAPKHRQRGRTGVRRRAFIAGAAVGCFWPLAGPVRLLRRASPAGRLGALYLRDHPEERAAIRIMFADSAGRTRGGQGALSNRDFCDGRLVLVDGWILSRTEARHCAAIRLGLG